MRVRTALLAAGIAARAYAFDAALVAQANASASPSVRPKAMIARIWHGRTLTAKADAYQKYLNAAGLERMLQAPGNHGAEILRRSDGPRTDFVVISYWESIEMVKRYEQSVTLERDREFLVEVEPDVAYYEVVRAGAR